MPTPEADPSTKRRLEWRGLIDAGASARLDRYIGYFEPYFNSHEVLDRDLVVLDEVRTVARSAVAAVVELRAGRLRQTDKNSMPALAEVSRGAELRSIEVWRFVGPGWVQPQQGQSGVARS